MKSIAINNPANSYEIEDEHLHVIASADLKSNEIYIKNWCQWKALSPNHAGFTDEELIVWVLNHEQMHLALYNITPIANLHNISKFSNGKLNAWCPKSM